MLNQQEGMLYPIPHGRAEQPRTWAPNIRQAIRRVDLVVSGEVLGTTVGGVRTSFVLRE